ncbi:hypothetical protein, conserved, partial [Eimeria tenella]
MLTQQQVRQMEHPALIQRREELVAEYIALEHALMLWAVREALEVQDELPFAAAAAAEAAAAAARRPPESPGGPAEAAAEEQQRIAALKKAEEEAAASGECLYSTMMEDLFFVLQASVSRALRSGDSLALCALVNHVAAALRCEVLAALRQCLESSKGPYVFFVQDEHRLSCYSIVKALEAKAEGKPLPQKL